MSEPMTTEVCSTIFWLKDHAESLVLEGNGWGRNDLSYTCGDGGYVVGFTRSDGDDWTLDHVSGEEVEMLLSDDLSDLIDRLNADADQPTVYFSCDPDDPTDFVASFAKDEASTRGSFGRTDADEATIDVSDPDAIQDVIYATVGPDSGNEMLCACWSLAHYIAVSELFIPREEFSDGWEAFTPEDFCSSSDLPRHSDLFCRMVGLAFGAAAEKAQREALTIQLAEGDE